METAVAAPQPVAHLVTIAARSDTRNTVNVAAHKGESDATWLNGKSRSVAEQLAVLQTATGHHPHTEKLHQQAMHAHAALGHLEAIRALRRRLTHALDQTDTEPGDETLALADQLITQLQNPTR